VHENVSKPALNTRPTILNLLCIYYYKVGLVKHFLSKYQVINEMQLFKEERNFITNKKQK
jgi:hypothetical protein